MPSRFVGFQVGGAGNEVSVSLGSEVRKTPSVLKLSSNDGRRQAVEMRPMGHEVPLQTAAKADNAKHEGKGRNVHFVNIDGDSAKEVDVPNSETVPPTAYTMKSFMSTLRGSPQRPTLAKQSVQVPPPRRENPKAMQEDTIRNVKMFLPKGINQTDQPYVVPKFMPTYREMMQPKPKPDTLVSIVENTTPSMQKWAIEWNNEPKKSISIEELKEDLIREAAEKSHSPPNRSLKKRSINESSPEEMYKDESSNRPDNDMKTRKRGTEPMEKNYSSVSESERSPPWKHVHIPARYETTKGTHQLTESEPVPHKIGQPLVDWVPPKYSSRNKKSPYESLCKEYSFQDAISNGIPVKTGETESKTRPKLSLPRGRENDVYFDTEQQKFHQWFRERMSAAVQSAVDQPKTTLNIENGHQCQTPQSNANSHTAFKDPGEPSNPIPPLNYTRQNWQAGGNHLTNISQNDGWKDLEKIGRIPPEIQNRPQPANVSVTSHEHERNSSFYQWLEMRGHHMAKNEPDPPGNKRGNEKANQNTQNAPLYPWSVSYTLRKRIPTPKKIPKRPQTSSKTLKKSQKAVTQDDVSLKHGKNYMKKSRNSHQPKRGGKTHVKSSGDVFVMQSSNKKSPEQESSTVPASTNLWLNGGWRVGSETDHVNNLRKMETFGHSSKGSNVKKLFPSLGGSQMKYWETKYIKKPQSPQNRRISHNVDGAKSNPYQWYMRKAANGIKNAPELKVEHSGRRADGEKFSQIAGNSKFPLKLPQNAGDQVTGFAEDFDVDNFLRMEDVENSELVELKKGHQENKVNDQEKTANEQQATQKLKGKEHIKFLRPSAVPLAVSSEDIDQSLKQKVHQKLEEDDFVLALGEDPGTEDLEWSEFIGPKNSFDQDTDLTTLIGSQARQLGAIHNSCL